MAKQFGKTAKMAGGGNTSMMPDGALIDKLYAALSGSGQGAQPASILYQRIKRANPGMSDAEAMQLAGMVSQPQAVAPSAAASGPVANQQIPTNTQIPQALANAVRAAQPQPQANVPGMPGLPQSQPMGPSGPPRPPIDSTAAMAAMAQQAATPSSPLNLPPPRMPSSPQGSIPMPSMPAAAQPQITGSGEDAPLPQPGSGATPPFLPSGKGKVNWRDFLQKALMSGAGGMAIGASGINPIAGGALGALMPLLTELLSKKKKKTETTEKKAKGGAVSSKKSGKKFGGSKKQAPKKPVPVEPDGDEQMMMPPGMPPGMMKKGGCVKKMASGGLVSRGMGAARGGGFKSY